MDTELKFEEMPGTNGVELAKQGNTVYIRIDLDRNFGTSKAGSNFIVASTRGNTKIPGTKTMLGLNAYRATPDE